MGSTVAYPFPEWAMKVGGLKPAGAVKRSAYRAQIYPTVMPAEDKTDWCGIELTPAEWEAFAQEIDEREGD